MHCVSPCELSLCRRPEAQAIPRASTAVTGILLVHGCANLLSWTASDCTPRGGGTGVLGERPASRRPEGHDVGRVSPPKEAGSSSREGHGTGCDVSARHPEADPTREESLA